MQTHNSYFLNSSIACLCLWLQVSKSELTLTPSRYTAADHQGVLVCWGGFCGVSPCLSVSCSEPAASENSGSVTLSQRFMKVFFFFLWIRETAKSPLQKAISDENCGPHNTLQRPCLVGHQLCSLLTSASLFWMRLSFCFALLLLLHLRASCLVTTLAVNRPKSLETFCVYQRNQRSSLASSSVASSSLMSSSLASSPCFSDNVPTL